MRASKTTVSKCFQLHIHLGNSEMNDEVTIGEALRAIADRVELEGLPLYHTIGEIEFPA